MPGAAFIHWLSTLAWNAGQDECHAAEREDGDPHRVHIPVGQRGGELGASSFGPCPGRVGWCRGHPRLLFPGPDFHGGERVGAGRAQLPYRHHGPGREADLVAPNPSVS